MLKIPFINSLKHKYVLSISAVVVIALLVTLLLVYRHISKIFYAQLNARLHHSAELIKLQLNQQLREIEHNLDRIVTDEQLRLLASDPHNPDYTWNTAETLMRKYNLTLLDILDDEGVVLSSGHEPGKITETDSLDLHAARTYPGIPFFRMEKIYNEASISLQASLPVKVGDMELIICGGIKFDQRQLQGYAKLLGADLALMQKDTGYLAAYANEPIPEHVIQSIPYSIVIDKRVKGNDRSYFVEKIALLNIVHQITSKKGIPAPSDQPTLYIIYDDMQLNETLKRMVFYFIIAGIMGIILATILGSVIGNRITKPILALSEASERVILNDHLEQIDITSHDEIGILVRSFNSMIRDLNDARMRIIQYQQVSAWKSIIEGLAHEIRNPLNNITYNLSYLEAELLEEFYAEYSEPVKYIKDTEKNINYIKEKIVRLSSFTDMPKPILDEVDLKVLLEDIAQGCLLRDKEHRLDIHLDIPDDLPYLRADATMMAQVFTNLFTNAIRAMEGTGVIKVSAEVIGDLEQQRRMIINFEDSGPGIPEKIIDRVFTPFVKGHKEGTGLGLAIVQRIIMDHDGLVTVRNRPEGGASFNIILPIKEAEQNED